MLHTLIASASIPLPLAADACTGYPTARLIFADSSRRGFMLVELTPTHATVDHVFIPSGLTTDYTTDTTRCRVRTGTRKAVIVEAT